MKVKLGKFMTLALVASVLIPIKTYAKAQVLEKEPIGPGAVRTLYQSQTNRGKVRINVVECDINNSNLEVGLVTGAGKYTQKATVSQMSKRTDSIALVNGDFFNMRAQGAPLGASVLQGRLVSAPMNSIGYYSLGIDGNNKAFIDAITFKGNLTAANGKSFPIRGLNKAQYWDNISGADSHIDTLHIYNDHWSSVSRGKFKSGGAEVLINANNAVEQVSLGSPLRMAVPQGKIIVQANNSAANFIRDNVKKGDKVQLNYAIYPKRNWKFLVGGHGLLVDNAVAIPYQLAPESIAGFRPRTAAGISADGKKIYLVSVEKSSRSVGMQLSEVSNFIAQNLKCQRAVNLDGGGSTAMTIKHAGDFDQTVVTRPGPSAQRPVVNGVGVFNRAKEGPLAAVRLEGPSSIVLGEEARFNMKGWDANYVAKKTQAMKQLYRVGDQMLPGNSYVGRKIGQVQVVGNINGIRNTMNLTVQGSEGLKSLNVKLANPKLGPGMMTNFQVQGQKKDKKSVAIDPSVAQYSLEGFQGQVQGNSIQVQDTLDQALGYLKVQYDKMTIKVPIYNKDYRMIEMAIGKKNYTIDGAKKSMDVAPMATNNRTLVPLRFLVESLGGQVDWDQEKQTIHINHKGQDLVLPLDAKTILVNGQEVAIDTPAMVKNQRTLVPIRFVVENLAMTVDYQQEGQIVRILEKQEPAKVEAQTPQETRLDPAI